MFLLHSTALNSLDIDILYLFIKLPYLTLDLESNLKRSAFYGSINFHGLTSKISLELLKEFAHLLEVSVIKSRFEIHFGSASWVVLQGSFWREGTVLWNVLNIAVQISATDFKILEQANNLFQMLWGKLRLIIKMFISLWHLF